MFISKSSKNQFNIAGHVSKNFIKPGKFGPFGMMIIAVDDGYYSKKESKFIERTQFIAIDVGKLKNMPTVEVGDYFDLDGKFEVEQWEDKATQKQRSEVKLKALKVNIHIPSGINNHLKEQGYVKPQQQYQQRPAPQQAPPQQGGYNNQQQPQTNGYAQQRGGYNNQQQPQAGGYHQAPPQQGGYNNQQQPQASGYHQAPPQQGATPNHWDYDERF